MTHTLILSTSLNKQSKSRLLAQSLQGTLGASSELIDMQDHPLPFCDAGAAYGDPAVQSLSEKIQSADAILVCSPIYNYTINAVLKNLIELTGKAWTDKVVGFAVAAGGPSSYMGILQIANSLMLDFRTVIIPRFVYASPDAFTEAGGITPAIQDRLKGLADSATQMGAALKNLK